MKKSYFISSILIIFSAVLILTCSRNSDHRPEEKILAKIGDKTISLDEFIQRAEYTIRPDYCRGDNYVHRKIVLNSLIAEKLLSLEAGGTNELTQNEQFKLYLQGRQEQAMRQWLYYHDFFDKVKLDSNEVQKIYKLSNRTYNLAYYTIKDTDVVKIVNQKFQAGKSFEQTFRELGGLERIPQKEISWDDPEHETIHNALFAKPIENNQVIGPLQIEKNNYITIKILGWTDKVLISDQDIRNQLKKVTAKVKTDNANKNYSTFIHQELKGRKVEFNPEIFRRIVNILGPHFIKSANEKQEAFNQQFWKKENPESSMDKIGSDLDQIGGEVFLRINEKVWTVEDFLKEITIHPLVFRKQKIDKGEFDEQFKFAVVDMIRDKFITQQAYNRGYDKVNTVQRNTKMWGDYLNALYYKNEYLKSINKFESFTQDYFNILEKFLNPLLDSLQLKYSARIEINTDLFEQTKLTNIDMFVLQKDVPFAVIVPSFPIVTTDYKLNYGRKME